MREVVIAGAGFAKIGERRNDRIGDIFAEAFRMLIDNTQIDPKEIEALVVGNMSAGEFVGQASLGAYLADYVGLSGIPAIRVEAACTSGGASVRTAYHLVASGAYDVVVAAGVEKMTDTPNNQTTSILAEAAHQEYETYFGASFVALNALMMRYYLDKYKPKREAFAKRSVYMHQNAVDNPRAQFRRPVKLEQVLNSTIVADPLTIFECAPIGDGSAAVLLTTPEKAKELGLEYVKIAGAALATDRLALHERDELDTLKATLRARERAYKQAKIEPKDVDLIEIHDAFSIMAVLALEDLGFAKKGEGRKLIDEGVISRDGSLPANLGGGLKARGHPVGSTTVYGVGEAYLNLLQKAPRKSPGGEVAVVQGIGGTGSTVSVFVLRR